jgi:DNA-directed RNA polymerase specialized sigma24 family protein
MAVFQKALRLQPEGFFICPAFLPRKTNLTGHIQDFRGWASFAACVGSAGKKHGYSPQPLQFPFLSEAVESESPLFCALPVCLWVAGSSTMPLEIQCHCTLCNIEAKLFSALTVPESRPVSELLSAFPALHGHSTVSDLLFHLRASPADAANDNLFHEIFALREANPEFAESLLVLLFLPMLHRVVRLITRQQENLAEEDIAQQVLFFFLQFLHSPQIGTRRSHFAFAIARGVKRHIFEWAKQESTNAALLDHANGEASVFVELEDSFERFAQLRHFLHRCVTSGMLADSELDLLIQFKLDGNTGDEMAALNGSSSNAVRQRFKRLLAKLRRLAR